MCPPNRKFLGKHRKAQERAGKEVERRRLMPKETKKEVLQEARELAQEVYCLEEEDEVRSMDTVYKIVDRPSDVVSSILAGVAPDMADLPELPYVLEDMLKFPVESPGFDPDYLWTGQPLYSFPPEEGVLTGEEILDRLEKVKKFLGKNPKKAVVFFDDDGICRVEERPTTLSEVRKLRDHLRGIREAYEAEAQKADAARERQKNLEELVKTADEIGLENAIAKLKE
jgi:hypothetical protein